MAATPARLRSERLTELIGDILLTCTGGSPTPFGRSIPQANITIYLPANVTSRVLSNGGSEALLLIDEPGGLSNPVQRLCPSLDGCVVPGNGGTAEPFDGRVSRPNIFQGVVSENAVSFANVPIDAPGQTGTRTYRITNVRIDTSAGGARGTQPVPVIANISLSDPSALPLDNPQAYVGFISRSLVFTVETLAAGDCGGFSNLGQYAQILFTEGFASAARERTVLGADPTAIAVQNQPGTNYPLTSESGFIFPGLPGAGLADFGTRLRAVFTNIPPGLGIWVSTKNLGAKAGMTAQLVSSEAGPYQPVSPTTTLSAIDAAQIPVVNGTAVAVWEVTSSNPALVEAFAFAAFFDGAAPPDDVPAPAVNGSYAPTFSPAGTAPMAYPIPSSADTSSANPVISVPSCRTILLFPFVVHAQGFDTGIAISNTSTDPMGTSGQSGTCTLSAFGTNPAPSYTTPRIGSGTSYTVLASTALPDFAGYVFAVCRFPYGHGFAFISDVGARNLAMGYLPLVIGTSAARPAALPAESLVR
jgi:hypothetical protein